MVEQAPGKISEMTKEEFMEYWLKIPPHWKRSDWLHSAADYFCQQSGIPRDDIQILFDDAPMRAYILEAGVKWYGYRWCVDKSRLKESTMEYVKYLKATHERVILYRKSTKEKIVLLMIIPKTGPWNQPGPTCAELMATELEYAI